MAISNRLFANQNRCYDLALHALAANRLSDLSEKTATFLSLPIDDVEKLLFLVTSAWKGEHAWDTRYERTCKRAVAWLEQREAEGETNDAICDRLLFDTA